VLQELIFNENWDFVYLVASWIVLFLAYSRGSWVLQYTSVLLWSNWLFANLLLDTDFRHTLYLVMDSLFVIFFSVLWYRTREAAILTVVTLFSLMVLTHLLVSEGWPYLLVLNMLFAGQLYTVGRAAMKTPLYPEKL